MAKQDTDEKLDRLTTLVTGLTEAIAGIVGEREAALRTSREQEAQFRRLAAENAKSCAQRTQEAADRLYPDGTRYSVALFSQRKVVNEMTGRTRNVYAPDPAFPKVEVSASSPEEAQARYQKLCGIVATEGQIRATPAGEQAQEPGRREDADERLPEGVEVLA